MEIAEFLLARIAETEAAVWGAIRPGAAALLLGFNGPGGRRVWTTDTLIAECEAKRRIVRAAQAAEVSRSIGDAEDLAWAYTHDILRMLALPYADHPDYDPEWKV